MHVVLRNKQGVVVPVGTIQRVLKRRGLVAMVEELGHRKRCQATLLVNRDEKSLGSLLEKYRELRIRERQIFAFMLRLAIGRVSPERLKRHLWNKLPSKDVVAIYSYLTGRSPYKRIRALIVIFHLYGVPTDIIVEGIGIHKRTVKKYIRRFRRSGVDALFPPRKVVERWEDPKYKDALFGILHSPPKDHGFNRTTWKVKDLACVLARIGMPMGRKRTGAIIRNAGYRFIKAREVLTSNDPEYREKV